MRLGINLAYTGTDGVPLACAEALKQAGAIEAAGFDGIWIGDSISRYRATPDPLMWLLLAAAGSERMEVGTAVVQVPLRNPVELAKRVLTLHALARGRFTFGVGAGSTRNDFAAVGVDYSQRFRLFSESMAIMRRLCDGEQVGEANLMPWPVTVGGPPVVVGSWASGPWVRRAAIEYDGWMASGRTSLATLREGIGRYRDAGGRRALVATVHIDLTQPSVPLSEEEPFTLICGPEAATERLQRIAALGYDDVLLVSDDHSESNLRAMRELFRN